MCAFAGSNPARPTRSFSYEIEGIYIMPRALKPGAEISYVLRSDRGTENEPAEQPPTFYFQAISMDEEVRLGSLLERHTDKESETDIATFRDFMLEELRRFFVRTENCCDWDSQDLSKLTLREALELVRGILDSSYVTPAEKKSSE